VVDDKRVVDEFKNVVAIVVVDTGVVVVDVSGNLTVTSTVMRRRPGSS
jgi:hypothetical protein